MSNRAPKIAPRKKPVATMEFAQRIFLHHPYIQVDQFLAILRIRGFEVTDLQPKPLAYYKSPTLIYSCKDCFTDLTQEQVRICQEPYCEIPLCEHCLYSCEGGCQKSFCAEHVVRQVDGVMWCEACVRAHVVELRW